MYPLRKLIICCVTLFTTLFTVTSIATTAPKMPKYGDSGAFYEIGGGTRIRESGGVPHAIPISAEASFGLGLSCSRFDPKYSIEQTFNQLRRRLVDLSNALRASVAALPMFIICRAQPMLCQLMQNYTVRVEELVQVAVKNCRQMEEDLAQGRDPLDGWIKIGQGERLEIEGSKTGDIITAVESSREYDPDDGVKWVGGNKAGGKDQPPIRPIADTVKAGFNFLLGREPTDGNRISGSDDPLVTIWDTPEAAAKWMVEVVGEYRPDINNHPVQSSVGGSTSSADDGDGGKGGEDVTVDAEFMAQDVSTPGLGLAAKVDKERRAIREKLDTLLAKRSRGLTVAELTEVTGKSSTVIFTPELLQLLRASPMQDVFLEQLAEDAAIMNVVRYAQAARRMLIAGRNEPHIAAYQPANKEIDRKVATLEREIEALLFDRKIQHSFLAETTTAIFERQARIMEQLDTTVGGSYGGGIIGGARRH